MITLKNVSKYYYKKGIIASGCTKINLDLNLGEFVAITGESGSGKSTLLNVISGLDSYEEGEMYINGQETSHYTEEDFQAYRRKYISNIFQNFNLVNSYTVYQNIELILLLNGQNKRKIKQKINDLIKKVGLEKYKNTKVSKLSGGQKQRVAIARALAKDTPIIIADEPTGSLDSKQALEVIKILHDISANKLVIIVTHNFEQVEKYVTRKIKMYDGKIIEDNYLTPPNEITLNLANDKKQISTISKFRLGIRNAFNIIPKFLLVLFVYLFIIFAITSEYAYFSEQSYYSKTSIYNPYFINNKINRIVLKKTDKTPITDNDLQTLKQLEHIKQVQANDYLYDTAIFIHNTDQYSPGTFSTIDNIKGKIAYGRKPTTDNEILIECYYEDYTLNNQKIIGQEVEVESNEGLTINKKYTIVGIKLSKNIERSYNIKIYGSSNLEKEISSLFNREVSTLKVLFENTYYDSNYYDINYQIVPNNKVPLGSAIISSDLNSLCDKEKCLNHSLDIEISNIYYQDALHLSVSNTYNRKTFENLLGLKDFDSYNGAIFVNTEEFNKLFEKETYQSSVFVDDIKYLDELDNTLKEMGYSTLKIKSTLENEVTTIINIARTIVTIILTIALFFISYFVIRIIMKSRSHYFGTIRILGATTHQAKQILAIELLTISNLASIIFINILYLEQNKIINVNILKVILKYLTISDYLILYLVITLMSYLISIRFAKKIFKNSAMSTMREG